MSDDLIPVSGVDADAIIVHHRSPQTLQRTVDALCAEHVAPERILVVDNSPTGDDNVDLTDRRIRVVRTANRGFAAAANHGIALLAQRPPATATIVCSHEAEIMPGSLAPLLSALDADERISAAGPTLSLAGSGRLWSTGGVLTPRLHLARHTRAESASLGVVERDWVDGAFVVYRTSVLQELSFDERYFLYFEETDLHTRMRRAGHRVVWVSAAHATQTSTGMPPRTLGRYLTVFHHTHFTRASGARAVWFESARALARTLGTGHGAWGDAAEILRGRREALRES